MSLISPNNNSEILIDDFILYATTHLATIGGTVNTISLYPPTGIPAPGILTWTGYFIPPAKPTTPTTSIPRETLQIQQRLAEDAANISPQQLSIADNATDLGYDIVQSTSIGLNSIQNPPPPQPKAEGISNKEESPSKLDPTQKIEGCDDVKIKEPPKSVIDAMKKWGIETPLQRAHFLSQCAHESGNFYYTREIWGPTKTQQRYEGRKDLGNVEEGDGFKFLGRGFIQLTGRSNYKQFSKGVTDDIIRSPSLVETKYVAETACWYWKTRKLNDLCIDDTVETVRKITKKINGGFNGLDDRVKKFCVYWKKLQENPNLYT